MKSLLEELLKVDLNEARVKVLSVGAMGLAHYKDNLCAVYWYNILTGKLEYSEAATTHQDHTVFRGPFENDRGWIRGRVFVYKGKYYIVAYLEDWLDFDLTNRTVSELYRKIQSKCKYMISDIVDEEGYTLTENKKKGK